jgi:hypothetical protein
MFTMKELDPYFEMSPTLEISGMTFKLMRYESAAGDLAVWYSNEYQVLATPYFDNVPIPVEVHKVEGLECITVGTDAYYVEVESYERYCKVTKTLAEKIIRRSRL